jgi:hypothetical protein
MAANQAVYPIESDPLSAIGPRTMASGEDDGHLAQRRLLVAKQASIGPCAC